jgi:hypothetical protein
MIEDNLEITSENGTPDGIWANFMKRLSVRTGLAIHWLQFIGLLIGALAAFLVSEWFHQIPWDSAALLFRVVTVLSAVGAVVVLLPSVGRRIVISLFILFHFGGILTAVTSVNPSPWVVQQVWTSVYRPYLYFLWLNNAYHFYSPEPGPAYLMWYCIEYEPDPDGTKNFRWVMVPDLDEKGHPMNPDNSRIWSGTEYTRRLSLAEYTGTGGVARSDLFDLLQMRLIAGHRDGIPPFPPNELRYELQYREPGDIGKRWIQSYVRHVAYTYKHENKPDRPVVSVKFYRVIHQFMDPGMLNSGGDPNERRFYWPFYYGEFDKDGNMKKECEEREVDMNTGQYRKDRKDPYLYWLIPIDYVVRHAQGPGFEKADSELRKEQFEQGGDKTEKEDKQ